jgi:hypothetical protein
VYCGCFFQFVCVFCQFFCVVRRLCRFLPQDLNGSSTGPGGLKQVGYPNYPACSRRDLQTNAYLQ